MRMPRIVIVGEPREAGLHASLMSAFRQAGCDVNVLDLGHPRPAWLASVAYRWPRFGVGFRREFHRRVDEAAAIQAADVVVVFKGPWLDSRSIDHLRLRFECRVVCWNADSPFDDALANRGAGIPQAIGAYDAYITWTDHVAEQLSRVAAQVLVIPFAWDSDLMRPTAGHGVAADRIVFIGTGSKERCALLQSLAHMQPLVFGTHWPRIKGVEIRPPVLGTEFCRIAGEARWNLNILRPQNARSHNMRTFELVGAGGNQVAPQTPDHQSFLKSDSRTILFNGQEQLEAILRSDPGELPPRPPSVLDGHTYADRARQLMTDLEIS
jgi:hypothetical protein